MQSWGAGLPQYTPPLMQDNFIRKRNGTSLFHATFLICLPVIWNMRVLIWSWLTGVCDILNLQVLLFPFFRIIRRNPVC